MPTTDPNSATTWPGELDEVAELVEGSCHIGPESLLLDGALENKAQADRVRAEFGLPLSGNFSTRARFTFVGGDAR